jgi:hypothetical protein
LGSSRNLDPSMQFLGGKACFPGDEISYGLGHFVHEFL